MVDLDTLREMLDPLDAAAVECDGMARLVTTRLQEAGIEHWVMLGAATYGTRSIRPHLWIEVGPFRVDYRARMWFGDEPDIPHGVMKIEHGCCVRYQGNPIDLMPLSSTLFALLAAPAFLGHESESRFFHEGETLGEIVE